jgi:hypothetical protein
MRLVMYTAGETTNDPRFNFVVATQGGRELSHFDREEDAQRFMEEYKEKGKNERAT